MSIFANLFKKQADADAKVVGNVEDFVSLTRVYFQSVIAVNLGITNIRFLPDVANFKRLFKVATQGGKLGLAEKSASRKMLMQDYGISESFFKEIDTSIKKNCRTQNDVQAYLFMYQGFSSDLMMLMGNLMKFKLRLPSFMKNSLYKMTAKTVEDIFTKNDFSDASVLKTVLQLRQFNKRLAFSQQWVTDFTFQVLMLAKKEPRPSDEDVEKAKQKMGK